MEEIKEMKTKTQSYCWWFQSYNTSNSSPWLQSSLSELNEKTKTMLKLIDEDADSFAQRAEMYYKKRPELISMVEDFYRAHRSLAERYDQLKSDRAIRIRSPLRHSLSLPKEEFDYALDSVKSFDSFAEQAYSSEEAAESEVDDPEEEDGNQIHEDNEIEKFSGGASYDELMKLRDELDQLRGENAIMNSIIKKKDNEKEEFLKRLSGNMKELREFREEMGAIKVDKLVVSMKEIISEVSVPFDEVTKLTNEIERLKTENLYQKEQAKKKAEAVVEVTKKFEAAKFEVMKLEQLNGYFENALAIKEDEISELTRKFEVKKSELAKLRHETRREKVHLGKYDDKKVVLRNLKESHMVRKDENCEPIWQMVNIPIANDLENNVIKMKNEITEKDDEKNETIRLLRNALVEKDTEKIEAIRRLKDAIIEKDMEKNEVIRQLNNTLKEKDEEKREAIRQLSIAMEILMEESKLLKKTIRNISPMKKSVDFQVFKGVNLGKLFS